MKKILFIFLVIISVIEAKPCMTDIYFGNGVWNDKDGAIKSRDYLEKFMLYKANTRLDPSKNKKDYRFGYVHNPSHGTFDDLIETFWQLKVSGQIDYGLFWAEAATLATVTGSNGETEIREKINQIVSQYNNDIIPILHAYQGSFNQKHNVLLVAHSQGNLFGNKIYELLSATQQKKFRMVSVATPASYVTLKGQTSPYVTASEDYVIAPIPGSLPGNVDGRGHTFLGTYLSVKGEGLAIDTGSIRAPRKIALYVKSAYDNLMQTSTCDTYQYYVWISYMCPVRNDQELIVDIYGRPDNAPFPYKKQLVAIDNRIRIPQDMNGNCTVQGDDVRSLWSQYDKNGCYAYSIDDTTGNIHTLDYVANKTYDNGGLCTRYKMSSDVETQLKATQIQ